MIIPSSCFRKGFVAPSDRLLIAFTLVLVRQSDIAMFHKGKADIGFLCDVDTRRAAKTVNAFPKRNFIKIGAKCLIKNTKILMRFP
jgi:hypothetical protein